MTDTVVQTYKPIHAELSTNRRFTVLGYEAPQALSFEDWMEDGRKINTLSTYAKFLLGDWINAGERIYGEKYAQAIDNGVNYNTAIKCSWVARKIKPAARTCAFQLPFSLSELIAKQEFDEETQADWLHLALERNMTTMQLAEAISIATNKLATPVNVAAPDMPALEQLPQGSRLSTEEVDEVLFTPDEVTMTNNVLVGVAVDEAEEVFNVAQRLDVDFADMTQPGVDVGFEVEAAYNEFAGYGRQCLLMVPVIPAKSWWTLLRDFSFCLLTNTTQAVAVVNMGVPVQQFAYAFADIGDVYVRQAI